MSRRRHPSLANYAPFAGLLGLLLLPGCAPVVAIGVRVLYRHADLPASQIRLDRSYAPRTSPTEPAQRLDLYLPAGRDWPLVVFVHGGNWDRGDKSLRVGGADVYANIGRFHAARGIGVAVIDYRLQPAADWREQVADVRAAVQWASDSIAAYGGRSDALFLMGHSAGAQLSCHVAFAPDSTLRGRLRGVIAVSGAGLDLVDPVTWSLGEDPAFYARRFRGKDPTDAWRREASVVPVRSAPAPPCLILHAGGEKPGLKRQSQLLRDAVVNSGGTAEVVVVPGQNHSRIVLTLSRADRTAGPAIEAFIQRYSR